MKVSIIKFEGKYAICRKKDLNIINIKRNNIPMISEERDILNVKDTAVIANINECKKKDLFENHLMLNIW
ncbi:hypothetical protein [Clostridium sp. OS1-26]|uniref:hypothetical protein n=1 Tax=Clostridium sp. OS1-26 TaxID=3070681 RepID=UPI0027DFD7B8|nr:hypothetical protein [Clostridium sp. OS1-26]WML34062.1 hypothetical protein RCG18_22560 [Clostridium sp. OS1-26]